MPLFRPAYMAFLALAPLPAIADTTPEAVWQMVQANVVSAGGAISATPSRQDDTLILQDLQLALDRGAMLFLPEAALRQMADGSVRLELPPDMPVTLDLPPRGNAPDKLIFRIGLTDLDVVFRDTDQDMTISASAVSVSLTDASPRVSQMPQLARFEAYAETDELTFNPADQVSYYGFPAPEGPVAITLSHTGATQQALVDTGWIDEDKMAVVRLMLASLASPGPETDQLVSAVDFRQGGSVFVNGRQLR